MRFIMYLKLSTLCLFTALTVNNGFKIISLRDGHGSLVELLNSLVVEPETGYPIFRHWIDQKLDHFDANETRTWKMRYYGRLDFWKTNGPVYLYINGESLAAVNFLATGVVYDLARETNGAMYLSEHRYYGKSQPLNRNNTNTEHFKYLSAQQALADIAHLLRTIKKNILFKNSKIVVIGGSYGGNLAAWLKLVYPDLVDAAISSSSPVLAKRDFYEYLEVVGYAFKKYGSIQCYDRINYIFQRYDSLFRSEAGISQLMREENICEGVDMTKIENKQLFFLTKAYNYMIKIQMGNLANINDTCLITENAPEKPIFSDSEQYYWSYKKRCFHYDFEKMIREYRKRINSDSLSWAYQTCNEFGYFQSTTSYNQPFTQNIPVKWHDKLCRALFGPSFTKERINRGIRRTNQMFGQKSPNVSYVVFVNGELDPWSPLGIIRDLSPYAPAIYIPRTSHCKDLFSNEKYDDEYLIEARYRIKGIIKKWIGIEDYPACEGTFEQTQCEQQASVFN